MWHRSHQQDPFARWLADRHYCRVTPGSPKIAPAGRQAVLYAETPDGRAYWVSSWPRYAKHEWVGAWNCAAFRQEGRIARASDMIRAAVAATRFKWGDPPAEGMITFINPSKVRPTKVRGRDVFGWTWIKSGFHHVGETKVHKHLVFRLEPEDMPSAAEPLPGLFGLLA